MDSTTNNSNNPAAAEKTTTSDLSVKYQRLASEYSKMRAQNTVLKKAVLEEQAKNLQLKDEMHLKDQSIRKAEQEMDSLSFRNTQLEKRVGFLQDELATAMSKGKGKVKGKTPSNNDSSTVGDTSQPTLDYELLSKIEENIALHKQISEMEEISRREVAELKLQLEQSARESPIRQLKEKLNNLEEEKLTLSYSLQNSLDEIEAYRDQVNQLQDKIRNLMINPNEVPNQGNNYNNNHLANNNKNKIVPQLSKSQSSSDDSALLPYDTQQVNELQPLESTSQEISIPNLVEKLTSAEQQREHLMLEYQLLKMKYSKIFMKWEEAKEILKVLGKEDLMSGDITPCTETVQSFTTMIGKIDVISDDPQSWGRSYEKEVKDYLTTRINELIGLLQLADSKAVTFYTECINLQNLLSIAADKKKQVESQLNNHQKQYNDLQEELQLTKNNYESQLTTMTDYLANMNEKLTAQQDQIDDLTYQLTQKGTKPKK